MKNCIRIVTLGLIGMGSLIAACIGVADVDTAGRTDVRVDSGGARLQHTVPIDTSVAPQAGVGPVHLVAAPTDEVGGIPGFALSLTKSRFEKRAEATFVVDALGIARATTADSTFVAFPNGFSASRPLGSATGRSPMTTNAEAHNDETRAYFTGAGLPEAQVNTIQANTIMDLVGEVGGARKTTFGGFVSVISRKIGDTRIEGSYAWAQFSENGELVAESVWWPPLPARIFADVSLARAALAQDGPEGFRTKIPSSFAGEPGEIVVHHPGPVAANWYEAVTIDFEDGSATASFTAAGMRVSFNPPQASDTPR